MRIRSAQLFMINLRSRMCICLSNARSPGTRRPSLCRLAFVATLHPRVRHRSLMRVRRTYIHKRSRLQSTFNREPLSAREKDTDGGRKRGQERERRHRRDDPAAASEIAHGVSTRRVRTSKFRARVVRVESVRPLSNSVVVPASSK